MHQCGRVRHSHPNTAPAKLQRGPAPMARGTANVALCDFRGDLVPGLVGCELHDLAALRRPIAMIEVQDDWVALSTVDARMRQQIRKYPRFSSRYAFIRATSRRI